MANVDYDPVKAHEYYEKHKKLKGRHSTKGWNDTQKAQWSYAKDQLATEHKAINQDITEESKAIRQQISEAAKERIAFIRERVKGMSKEQKAAMKEVVDGMIATIREQLGMAKEEISEATKAARSEEKEAYEGRKDAAYAHISKG